MLIMPPWTVSALGFHKKISTMETWEEQRLHKHQRQSSNTQFTLRNNGMDSGPSWLLGLLWQENIIWVWEKLNLNIIIQIIYLTRHLEEKKKKQRPTCQDTDNRTILLGELHPILFCNCLQNETLTGFPHMGCGPRELFGLFLQKFRGWEWEHFLQKLFEIWLFTRIEGCLPEGCWQQGRGVT